MTNLNQSITIALLQLISKQNNQQANLEIGEKYCREAKTLGADIVLFPEMWNIGYTSFSADVFKPDLNPYDPSYTQQIKLWQAQAITQSSKFFVHFQRLARELNLAIAITYLAKTDHAPQNTLALIDRHGQVLFTYAKVHTCDFSLESACSAGTDFYVAELDTLKGPVNIGAMICFDREFPESARILMLKSAEIILVPNACHLEEYRLAQIKTRAFENMLAITVANYAKPQENGHSCAFDGIAFNSDGSYHNSCIIEADEEEGIILANIEIDKIREYRQQEVWGNAYRKPTCYSLLTSTEVKAPFVRKYTRN